MARDLTTGYGGRPHSGNAPPLAGYRFGCGQASLGHERSALDRATGFLKNLAEAITNAKLRRMRRELELHGIHLDQSDEAWIASSLRDHGRNR